MKRADTKTLIAETALRLFVENGIAETSVRDIAEAAGIAEGTMYRHYTSKDELASSLFLDNVRAFSTELKQLGDSHDGLNEQLAAVIRRVCAFFDESPLLFRYLLLSQHSHARDLRPKSGHPLFILRAIVARAIERREIPRCDPMIAASMVLGLVLQVATSRIYGRFDHGMSALAETLIAACGRVLRLRQASETGPP